MLTLISSLFIFIFGLAVGSFLNCIIYRLERGENFFRGRSYCPHCRHQLSFLDLIPVLSFILLKGKCRYCLQKISLQYPLVELTTGLLFVATLNFTGVAPLYFIVAPFLIVIFVYDLKHYIIPDKVLFPAIVTVFLYQFFGIWNFGHWDLFRISDLGFGILPSFFLLSIILLSRGRWMGLGDFKLAILMGLILSWPNILVSLVVAFFSGAIIGLGLIMSGKKTLKSEVPFGPFLVTGTFIALFWGKEIINLYFGLVNLAI